MAKNPRSGKEKRREKGKERENYWAEVMKEQAKKEKAEKAKAKKEQAKKEKAARRRGERRRRKKKRLKSECVRSQRSIYQERTPIFLSKEINRSG